jgi:hypothetical protein
MGRGGEGERGGVGGACTFDGVVKGVFFVTSSSFSTFFFVLLSFFSFFAGNWAILEQVSKLLLFSFPSLSLSYHPLPPFR